MKKVIFCTVMLGMFWNATWGMNQDQINCANRPNASTILREICDLKPLNIAPETLKILAISLYMAYKMPFVVEGKTFELTSPIAILSDNEIQQWFLDNFEALQKINESIQNNLKN
ncbi:MAG: hypothetical protein LBQ08_00890 [Holosporaceae bacterium]|nr:hypothetical protein [Holosporaceae bacterium]